MLLVVPSAVEEKKQSVWPRDKLREVARVNPLNLHSKVEINIAMTE